MKSNMKLDVPEMYIQWLSGKSIRTIAREYGVGRMSVYGKFVKSYGKDCCNLRRQSLARVVYKEYGDLELAMTARGSEGIFRTKKTENNYSKLQTTDLSTYNLAAPVDSCDTNLLMPGYMYVLSITAKLLYLTMMSRMNKLTV